MHMMLHPGEYALGICQIDLLERGAIFFLIVRKKQRPVNFPRACMALDRPRMLVHQNPA